MTSRNLMARASLLSMIAGLLLAALSLGFMTLPAPAGAASPSATDGSDWGAQGALSSDSAVTVAWDNTGNNDADTVERNSLQKLPHTLNKTYASIPAAVRTAYASAFGTANGKGGLQVTVSQTQSLLNQSVTVTATGGNRNDNGNYLQIFQCWGTDGESDPDPAHCQSGAVGPDVSAQEQFDYWRRASRSPGNDSLLDGGDWAQYKSSSPASTATGYAPFVGVDGTAISGDPTKNTLYNGTTTNEWDHATFDPNGRVQRQFEMQTGSESSGLGCGYRPDAPSTDSCWLVVIPRIQTLSGTLYLGSLAPQVWGQRLQVRLGFQNVFTACPNGRSALLLNGSEALRSAAASWTPGACAARNLTLSYTATGDEVARNQFAAGGSDAITTTQPVRRVPDGAQISYTPLGLTAPVIAYTLDYVPACVAGSNLTVAGVATESGDAGESDAKACGYSSLAALQADANRIGTPITDLRLDARLVVKLLTQFYGGGRFGQDFFPLTLSWTHPGSLVSDPEFQALNPGLSHLAQSNAIPITRAFVEGARSDEAAELWAWALQDEGAASFLAGCPDPYDQTINPFYSTRTYAGCEFEAKKLKAAAAAERSATSTPDTFVDGPLSYPPDGSPYPMPGYYVRPAKLDAGNNVSAGPLNFTDEAPVYDNTFQTARQTALYGLPNIGWCNYDNGGSACSPAKWKPTNNRMGTGQRAVAGITDAGSAATYQLSTAKLCDEDGVCVGADTASLQAAARRFTTDGGSHTLQPPADLSGSYAAGAYPLTMPVYAAVNVTSLDAADRTGYADAFSYITSVGQNPGFDPGDLPPGYAPLTPNLRDLAAAGIAQIRAGAVPSNSPTTTPPGGTGDKGGVVPPGDTPTTTPSAAGAPVVVPADGPAPSAGAPSAGQTMIADPVVTPGALVPVSAGTETWPRYTLPLGLGIALLSGLVSPALRSRVRWRLHR